MTTRRLHVEVFGPAPKDIDARLRAVGMEHTYSVAPMVRDFPAPWALSLAYEPPDEADVHGDGLNVGWVLGVLGVVKDTQVEWWEEPT